MGLALNNFPQVLKHYNVTIPYSNPNDKQLILQEIADKITDLYARHLLADTHAKVHHELTFSSYPEKFPDPSEVEQFQSILKNIILEGLKETNPMHWIKLTTHYYAENKLEEALDKSNIRSQKYGSNLGSYFPRESITTILDRIKNKELYVSLFVQNSEVFEKDKID